VQDSSVIKPSVSKYREVNSALRAEIASGLWAAGEQIPGEHDLARRFGVAYMTMRQAVTVLVDEGLLCRVRGKGTFVVDRSQAPAESTTLRPMALLLPNYWQTADPYYYPQLLSGFQQEMEERGHSCTLDSYESADARRLIEQGSAVACLLVDENHQQLVEGMRDRGHHVLAINRYTGRRSVPCVHIDDVHGVEQAVDHLVGLGHERLAFLRGPSDNLDAADRLRGYRAAVRKHGVRSSEVGNGFSEAAGYDALSELLTSPQRPTAVACASDLSAVGAIKAARDHGLSIPQDLSLVGFGDFSVSHYVTPSLTTVRQCRNTLGRTAAGCLIELAHGSDVADVVLSAELIVRESTAPPSRVLAVA